uniref:Derlin n=1 Tax=Timema monikensis TaxID=170555 RepID=A0A7R9HJZ1_9NEOP|nr:unnamed protein product [Timema monikensis]
MSDIAQWFKNLPIFTRYWLGLTAAFSLLGRFGLLSAKYLILQYEPFLKGFQLWRPVTAVFFYPLSPSTGFHFLINCYFLYNYSLRLETGIFDGRPADYFFMLLFNWVCCVIVALLGDIMLLMDPMVLSVLYVWCQLNKDMIVNFWFGTQFKAMYLPWVLLAFNLVISGGYKYFPNQRGGIHGFGQPPTARRPANDGAGGGGGGGGRHNWGQGNILGGQ